MMKRKVGYLDITRMRKFEAGELEDIEFYPWECCGTIYSESAVLDHLQEMHGFTSEQAWTIHKWLDIPV